jgi:transcription antitermination factor NusG
LRTRPRQEKKLARWLLKNALSYFVPLRRRVRNWRGRRIKSEEPLLAGYVFLRGDARAAARAFGSGAVAERLAVDDQLALFAELSAVERLCSLDRALSELPGLVEGREVELKAGPLSGLRGIIQRAGGAASLVIRLEMLGRAICVPLDPAEVEPV